VLAASRHVCFVPAVDLDRAHAFYKDILGLEFLYDAIIARVFRIGETTLRVTQVEHLRPQPFTVFGWEVDDVAESITELSKRGVAAERFDGIDQDEHGVWQAPSGALVAWFKDSEGNALSLTQKGTGRGACLKPHG
jgi:catechol 2,3-dioxygenase-like lactoylglutathione lyase family enzyme